MNFFTKYIKFRVFTYEESRTNILEAKIAISNLMKKTSKIEKTIENATELLYVTSEDTEFYNSNQLELKRIKEKVEDINERLSNTVQKLSSKPVLPDFSKIKLPPSAYNEKMINITEEQSIDTSSHIFTITNMTGHQFNNLRIYQSGLGECISIFSIKPNETKTIQEDFLFDDMKYFGVIFFQVFYCSFPLSKSIESPGITILNISYTNDESKIELHYKSHVTNCKDMKIMNNEIDILHDFCTKNFQKGSVIIDIQRHKGPSKFTIYARNVRISNEFQTIIE